MRNLFLVMIAVFAGAFLDAGKVGAEGIDCVVVKDKSGNLLAEYSIDDFRSKFPVHDLITQTPWAKNGEKTHYRGVRLKDVLAEHGLEAHDKLEVFADNGFLSEISMDEIDTYSPIIAYEYACLDKDYGSGRCAPGQEFRPLTIEDHGPFFLVWPYDELPEQYVPARNHLWVWWMIGIRPLP